jgi:hypothetical protein
MITSVEFVRFRGFERLRAGLLPHAYIVGPNSAGKSTVLEALGLAEQCLRVARRKAAPVMVLDNGRKLRGFPLTSSGENQDDPVRHEFGEAEARVSVEWLNGSRICIVWPEEQEAEERGFFFLEEQGGSQPRTPQATRSLFSRINVVPVVTPLERTEELKNPGYVQSQAGTRLASRHFRNHAWLMHCAGEWAQFKDFCRPWLPEIGLLDVSLDPGLNRLAIFYAEAGSRVPKELAWAGDGIQIWVQLLWHLFRAQGALTITLDEPEVYLHPDLQRRLVRILDSLGAQIVLATHSADVIAEAPPDGVLWVDRRLGGAKRAKSTHTLSALSASLGSSFNLSLARSMRARLVVGTDCEDPRVLRQLAKHAGATHLANEYAVSLVQFRDASRWLGASGVGESLREVLPPHLPAILLLAAGLRPKHVNADLASRLTGPGLQVKFWSRIDLDNYLLDPAAIARVSGAAPEVIVQRLADAIAQQRDDTRAALLSAWVLAAPEGGTSSTLSQAEDAFEKLWANPADRPFLVPGLRTMMILNEWLEADGYRVLDSYRLAKALRPQSIPLEIMTHLLEIDDLVR